MRFPAGKYNRKIRIDRPVAASGIKSAGKGTWVEVAHVWAEVRDTLPSKAETLDGGITSAKRPARVRMRYRTDITPDMRFVLGDRIMQIVSGPAELGNRQAIEFMAEDYTGAGNPA